MRTKINKYSITQYTLYHSHSSQDVSLVNVKTPVLILFL